MSIENNPKVQTRTKSLLVFSKCLGFYPLKTCKNSSVEDAIILSEPQQIKWNTSCFLKELS
jgi:hypothetical protein